MSDDWSSILKQDLQKLSEVAGVQPVKTEQLIPGERREVAILFLDLKGFTDMSETMDHEMVHKIIGGVMNALSNNVKGHGGYVDKIEGDKIMALFGADEANENDCTRAVACGLKMFEVLQQVKQIFSEKGLDLDARCGINFGSVTVAPDATGHITVMGDEVNLASRMESTAVTNTVQVTALVKKECGDFFEWNDLGEISVKGKQKPIHTYRPTGPGKVQIERWERAARVSRSPMVGREHEMEKLQSWWDRQNGEVENNRRGGAKHFVIGIKAEAGIGKSRLVHEFINSRSGDFTILKGQTLSYSQPPFWLWVTMLRDYFKINSGDPDAKQKYNTAMDSMADEALKNTSCFLSELLSIPSNDPRLEHLDDKTKHQETLIALRNFVRVIGNQQQTVIILEDLHWLDSSSKEAVEFVLTNCDTEKPLLCLCLYRPEEELKLPVVHKNYILPDEISLSPIDENSCKQLIKFMLGSASPDVEKFLLKQSQGNPFFLEELILDMIESGSLKETEDIWNLAVDDDKIIIPSAMSGLLRSRIDRLPTEQKEGLQHSSVIGMEFLGKMYRRLKEKLETSGEHEAVLSALEKREFINSLDDPEYLKYIFKHILTHNTAYSTILLHNRAILHRYAAEAIEELFPDELDSLSGIIANHWDRAGDREKTIEWGMKALKYCRKTYQNEEGLRWADRLIERLRDEPESIKRDERILEIYQLKCNIYDLLGKMSNWRQTLDQMLQLSDNDNLKQRRAETLVLSSEFNRMQGIKETEFEEAIEAVEISKVIQNSKTIVRALVNLAYYYRSTGDLNNAEEYLNEALDECKKTDLQGREGDVMQALAWVHDYRGHNDKAIDCHRRAIEVFHESGRMVGHVEELIRLGSEYLFTQENYDEAEKYIVRALKVCQESRNRQYEGISLLTLGIIERKRNRLNRAEDYYNRGLEISREIGDRPAEANFLGIYIGWLYHYLGKPNEALQCFQKGLNISIEIGAQQLEGRILENLGGWYFEQEEIDLAEDCWDKAITIFKRINDYIQETDILIGLGSLYLHQDNKKDAIEYYNNAFSNIEKKQIGTGLKDGFIELRTELIESGIPESDLPLPKHWEETNQNNEAKDV